MMFRLPGITGGGKRKSGYRKEIPRYSHWEDNLVWRFLNLFDWIGVLFVTALGCAVSAVLARDNGPTTALAVAVALGFAIAAVCYKYGFVDRNPDVKRVIWAALLVPVLTYVLVIPGQRARIIEEVEHADQVASFGQAQFRALDLNGNGVVRPDELKSYLAQPMLPRADRASAQHALTYIHSVGHVVSVWYLEDQPVYEYGISREDFQLYPGKVRALFNNWR